VDQQVVVYLSALIRAVIALHNLVNNKLENRSRELKVSPWFF
jgi:26S proteasome regulatory subunit N8